eukprot:NODE_34_length_31639_cov_0.254375.p21 type:complete len:117 gc:universal NODE_34_length_31639_cov_0.254375:13507-13157(-)
MLKRKIVILNKRCCIYSLILTLGLLLDLLVITLDLQLSGFGPFAFRLLGILPLYPISFPRVDGSTTLCLLSKLDSKSEISLRLPKSNSLDLFLASSLIGSITNVLLLKYMNGTHFC